MHGRRPSRLRSPLRSHRRRHRDRGATLASIGDSPFPSRRQALPARREAAKQHFEDDYYKSLSVCKKQNVIPTEVHTRSDATKQITLSLPPLYSISSPNPCLSASKAGRVTTLDVTCDAQFLVTLQSEARQATPTHRQPSLSLKQITTYYISCHYRLCLPVLQGSWVSKGTNHTVPVSSVSYVAQALEGTFWSLLALGNVSGTAVRD